jgi:hypothetical protein
MRTIEEIKEDLMYIPNAFASPESLQDFILDLDELIETVATLQREKCAEKAKINISLNNQNVQTLSIFSSTFGEITIDKESILNAKL